MERLVSLFEARFGTEPESVTLLPLSGSARKYWRMEGAGAVAIGCVGASAAENRAFLAIDGAMRSRGVNAPEIYGVSRDGMAYLQEDLGQGQLFELLKPALGRGSFGEEEKAWLIRTVSALPALQHRTGAVLDWDVCFPEREFSARMVRFDLAYFKYDFLKFTTVPFDEIRLQDDFDRLSEDALEPFGQTFMYRDFQARNVMIRDGEPWFIDFQGGRRGPGEYDLASFAWNAGTHFDGRMRSELERAYLDSLAVFEKVEEGPWRRRYRTMTLLRLLQETAAYGLRGMVERKSIFLDCIPAVLALLGELAEEPFERYPYLTGLLRRLSADWDGSTIMPGLKIER